MLYTCTSLLHTTFKYHYYYTCTVHVHVSAYRTCILVYFGSKYFHEFHTSLLLPMCHNATPFSCPCGLFVRIFFSRKEFWSIFPKIFHRQNKLVIFLLSSIHVTYTYDSRSPLSATSSSSSSSPAPPSSSRPPLSQAKLRC